MYCRPKEKAAYERHEAWHMVHRISSSSYLLEQVTDTLQKVTHGPTPMVRGAITNNKEFLKISLECWRRACTWNKVLGYSVALFTTVGYLLYVT